MSLVILYINHQYQSLNLKKLCFKHIIMISSEDVDLFSVRNMKGVRKYNMIYRYGFMSMLGIILTVQLFYLSVLLAFWMKCTAYIILMNANGSKRYTILRPYKN